MIVLSNLVNTIKGWNNEKDERWKVKDTGERSRTKDSTLFFFIRTILKEQWDLLENKDKTRTIKVEINTKKLFIQV